MSKNNFSLAGNHLSITSVLSLFFTIFIILITFLFCTMLNIFYLLVSIAVTTVNRKYVVVAMLHPNGIMFVSITFIMYVSFVKRSGGLISITFENI